MSAELVHYTVSDAIAQITLDRAPVNALSMPLIDALLEALEKAKDDASVRAVIICSAHKVFCAGLDLSTSCAASAGLKPSFFSSASTLRSTMSNIEWASRPSPRLTDRRAPVA